MLGGLLEGDEEEAQDDVVVVMGVGVGVGVGDVWARVAAKKTADTKCKDLMLKILNVS